MLTLNDIESLLQTRGHAQYSGEPVSQLQHALQTAALLHDLGHLVRQPHDGVVHLAGDTPTLRGIDDLQHFIARARRCVFC